MDLTVIFPAYNEAQRIGQAIGRAVSYFSNRYDGDVEIMVVENGSTDNTLEIAGLAFLRAAEAWPGRRISNLSYTAQRSAKGKGNAIRHGMKHAAGKEILITDVDLATPLYEIEKLQRCQADLAVGSRRLAGAEVVGLGIGRRISSAIFSIMAWPLTPGIRDTQCGFKLITSDAAKTLLPALTLGGYAFDVELIHAALVNKMRVGEVAVAWRHDERSKVNVISDAATMAAHLFDIAAKHAKGEYYL